MIFRDSGGSSASTSKVAHWPGSSKVGSEWTVVELDAAPSKREAGDMGRLPSSKSTSSEMSEIEFSRMLREDRVRVSLTRDVAK